MPCKHSSSASYQSSDKFGGHCSVKDVSLTLTDCLVSNSLILQQLKSYLLGEYLLISIKMLGSLTNHPVSQSSAICITGLAQVTTNAERHSLFSQTCLSPMDLLSYSAEIPKQVVSAKPL